MSGFQLDCTDVTLYHALVTPALTEATTDNG